MPKKSIIGIILILVLTLGIVGSVLAAPAASVTLGAIGDVFIGETFDFTVSFDNTDADEVGYGPFIDLYLPATGDDGDDGITFNNVSYLGVPITGADLLVQTIPAGGCVDHPFQRDNLNQPVQVCGNVGDQIVSIRLPFGSFAPDQPPVDLTVNVTLDSFAYTSPSLNIRARGGYEFGADPLDNPCCGDTPIVSDPPSPATSWGTTTPVTPIVIEAEKIYNGPESETATGPNFPQSYTITATIAAGQTINNLVLTDYFDDNIVITGVSAISPAGVVSPATPLGPISNGSIAVDFGTVVGGTATFTIDFYVPLEDAGSAEILNPTTGDDNDTENRFELSGNWIPLDPDDAPLPVSVNGPCPSCLPAHILEDQSIAIQKGVLPPAGFLNSGDVVEYTLEFQISDYFAFENIVITDILSDGQRFDTSFIPTLTLNGHANSNAGNFDAANYTVNPFSGVDGSQTLVFRVSDELVSDGSSGQVLGGCVPLGGTGSPQTDCAFDGGATTATIVYRAIIQDSFDVIFPSNDPSVDHGDILSNDVTIEGEVLSAINLVPTGENEDDDSGTALVISEGQLVKSIYAINGSTGAFSNGVEIYPGDEITFRLVYEMPSTDFEEFVLTDYLPLPVFDASEVSTIFDTTADASVPAAGQAKFGPSSPALFSVTGTAPNVSIDTISNAVEFDFGTFDDPLNTNTVVDILFTVTVTNEIFADGLYLTNQAQAYEDSTNGSTTPQEAIIQMVLRQPFLRITKGVIGTSAPSPTYSPNPPFPAGFPAGVGSNDLAANPVDSNVDGIDAGDLVEFAIVLENRGGYGAFDIRITDLIPAEYTIPAGFTLDIVRGDGTVINFISSGSFGANDPRNIFTNLSGGYIELEDPGPIDPACPQGHPDNGQNVLIIRYSLQTDNTVSAGQVLVNTASVTQFSNEDEHGDDPDGNFVIDQSLFQDDAEVTIAGTIDKDLIGTSEADSSDSELAIVGDERPVMIGEVVTYRLYTRVPEGTTNNLQFRDNTPDGLQYVAGSARFVFLSNTGTALSSSSGLELLAGAGFVGTDPTALISTNFVDLPPAAVSGGTAPGDDLLVSFGDVSNSANNDEAEYVVLEFEMVVSNIASNQNGTFLLNTATLRKNGLDLVTSDEDTSDTDNDPVALVIIEPAITITKTVTAAASRDAGDTVTYTITVQNLGTATAYDVNVTDILSADLGLNTVSTPANAGYTESNRTITIDPIGVDSFDITFNELAVGETVSYTVTATILNTALAGEPIDNTAFVNWTSLPGNRGTGDATPGNSGDDDGERNNADGIGGAIDDYRASDTESFTLNSHNATKSITATSETHTDNSSLPNDGTLSGDPNVPVTIGEIVRYQLVVDVPEGTSTDLLVIDQLAAGIEPIFDTTTEISTLNFGVGNFDSIDFGAGLEAANGTTVDLHNGTTFTFTAPFSLVDYNAGTNLLTFNLGDIVNNDSDANIEQIIISFNVVVRNTSVTNLGNIIANDFDVFSDDAAGTSELRDSSNVVNVVIQEPQLTIAKSVSPLTGDAGDTFTYTIRVENPVIPNGTTAFDIRVTDDLAALTDLDLTLVTINPAAGSTNNSNVGTDFVDVRIDSLAMGASVDITLTVVLRSSATPNEVITNTSAAVWTSLPTNGTVGNPTGSNTPGGSGADNGERDGSTAPAAPDDYRTTDTADLTVDQVVPVKSIIATSESHTDNSSFPNSGGSDVPVAIGEVVTFQLVVGVPEGTSNDVILSDILVPGLDYIVGSARVYTISDNSMTFASPSLVGVPNVATVQAAGFGTSIPAGAGLPTAAGTVFFDAASREVQINLGDILNNDNDIVPEVEQIVVTFQVVVANDVVTGDTNANGVNDLGDIWTNEFDVSVAGNAPVTSNTVSLIVQEPVLSIDKSIDIVNSVPAGVTEFDNGDTVFYTIVVTGGSGANENIAFDLVVTDGLVGELSLVNVTVSSAPAYAITNTGGSTFGVAGNVLVTISELRPTDTVIIQVETLVLNTVTQGQIIINTAAVAWTSLPGEEGTGDATPGTSGATNGERTGDTTGENDHLATDTVNFTVTSPVAAEKSIAGTSESDTSDIEDGSAGNERPVAIGEEITYRLAAVLPESTSISFTLEDLLVAGIEYVPNSARVSYLADTLPSFNGDFAGIQDDTIDPMLLFPYNPNPLNNGELRFEFDSIINNDGDADEEYIIIEFTVIVVDEAINNAGQLWANDFDVIVDEGFPTEILETSNEVGIIVVEPVLTLTKTFTPDEQVRGGTITMTLFVSNTGTAPIYDLAVLDVIDDWLNVSTIAIDDTNAPFANPIDASALASGFGDNATDDIRINLERLDAGDSVIILVTMEIDPDVDEASLPLPISNTANVIGDSLSEDDGFDIDTANSLDIDSSATDTTEDREYFTSASDNLTVVTPNLLVTKTASSPSVAAGALMSYSILIENAAPVAPLVIGYPATDVQFRDQIPTGFIVTLVNPSQGTCSPIVGGVLSCDLGTILYGANATVTITGRYPSTTASGTTVTNIAYVTSEEGNDGNLPSSTDGDSPADDERGSEDTLILRQVDVAITKVVDDASPNEGDLITFTLNVTNNGPSQATNVVVIDNFPDLGANDLTFVRVVPTTLTSSIPPICTYTAPTLTCTFPTLNVGQTRTIGIEATVDAGTAGTGMITNTATVTTAEPESDITNNSDDAAIIVDGMDLQVVKTVNNATPNEGNTIVYTITVTNLGPAPASGIQITDSLPADVSYVSDNSATTSTSYAGGVWDLQANVLDAGDSLSLQITATVNAGTSGTIIPNTASLATSGPADTNLTNNSSTVNIAVAGFDLSLIKGVNNPTPNEGDTIVYSIIVQNLGAANATAITVEDNLPPDLIFGGVFSVNRPGTTFDGTTWEIPSLLAGQSIRLDMTVTVGPNTSGDTIDNTAIITGPSDVNVANNSDDASITVGLIDLAVTKTVDNSSPNEGDTIVYSITVVNNGPARATGVLVQDNLPLGVTVTGTNAGALLNSAGLPTSYTAGTWDVGTLNAGASLTLQITATVDIGAAGQPQPIVNTATAIADQDETTLGNNSDDAAIAIGGLDLQVTKTVDNPTPNESDTIVYTITVENFGAANATNVVLIDDLNILPLSYVSHIAPVDSNGVATTYVPATGAWTITDLFAGQSLTLQITVTVNLGTSGTSIPNEAVLTAVDQADSNPDNNEDEVTVTVGGVDLEVLKVVDNPAPAQGDLVTYTITVTNLGSGTATNVVIDETLPLDGVNLSYDDIGNPATATHGSFAQGLPTSTWTIGTLLAGESATLTLPVTVEIADGQILNVASVSNVDQPDTDNTNDSDDATITLNGIDLAVVKTVDNPTPETGDTVTYTIVASNNGPSDATGVNVLDILPAGVSFVIGSQTFTPDSNDDAGIPMSYDDATGNWLIGELFAGNSRTMTLQAVVLVNGGTVVNTAEITGDQPESDSSNNVDDASINVDSADLSLTKSVNNNTPQLLDFITYTVTVRNAGPNIAYNVAVTDYLPTTVTYSSDIASQGAFDDATGIWDVGTLPVNGAASLQITVQVTSIVGTFVNIAEVTASDQTDPDSTPNNGVTTEDDYAESGILFDPPFGRKVFDASGLPELEWTVVWVNPNNSPLAVTVTDPIPAGTNFVTGSLTCTSPGTLVVNTCAFDPVLNEVVFVGTIFPDPGATPATIGSATNRLIINYRLIVGNNVREVRNEALLDSVNGDNVAVTATWRRDDDTGDAAAGVGAAILLTKYAEPAVAFPGETLTWILEVTNPSSGTATGIVVTDSIPLGLNIQTTSADAGTVTVIGQDVLWNVGTVAAGQTLRLRIVTQVSPTLNAPVTNTAYVTGDNVTAMEASATAAFVSELPNTGEVAWWTWFIWFVLIGGSISLVGLWFLRRRLA